MSKLCDIWQDSKIEKEGFLYIICSFPRFLTITCLWKTCLVIKATLYGTLWTRHPVGHLISYSVLRVMDKFSMIVSVLQKRKLKLRETKILRVKTITELWQTQFFVTRKSVFHKQLPTFQSTKLQIKWGIKLWYTVCPFVYFDLYFCVRDKLW